MDQWAWTTSLIAALVCGGGGLAIGYVLGFRNGSVTGELKALHVTIAQMRERRHSRRHRDEPETADRME